MSNRTTERLALSPLGRSSQFIRNIIPAGQTVPFPAAGTMFYVTQATAPFEIKPSGGSFNSYDIGTGLELAPVNAFEQLQIRNPSAFPIVFELFIGFDGFIDNRVIISQTTLTQISFPTYPTASAAAAVAINDLVGQKIADINGNQWYAMGRVAIIVSNLDPGVTLLLQRAGSAVANGPAVCAIFPVTSLNLPVSGDYSLSVGGGNINAIVSEIYNAIPATL